ncbi:hypothetical protein E3N88_26104 [Mikania micrantha]|uniref:CCHC-type domain-containing protein n=1 Tax=Mikania micrantha TaxID=192012 RepID=A0A5N6N6L3_9ASTR|nr:hypothetical protein E3N88_26104 [Mikania micrantha]
MAGQKGRPRKQPQKPEEPHVEDEEPVNEEDHEHNEQPENEEEFTLEPIVVKAISDEVCKIMDEKLPALIAKALKDTLKDKSEGTKESTKEDDVISAMEAVISINECRMDQAVKFAAHSFVEEALHWWNTIKQSKPAADIEKMTWDDLRELVAKQFYPKNELDKVEREFLVLKAGSLNHRQYTSRFNDLARLVPHLVATVERRVKLYMEGLPPKVRIYVKANAPKNFDSTVELSGIVWDDVMSAEPAKGEAKTGHFSNNCPSATRCYNCNGFGHLSKDCRQPRADASGSGKKEEKGKEKQKAKARAFMMTKDDAIEDPDVVTRTFSINNIPASVLFDSGASMSFVSSTFCDGLSGKVKKIDRVIDVETAIG